MKLASAEDLLDSSGPWIIPAEIELGIIDTSDAFFTFDFAVPIPCRLVSRVQGIDFDPPALAPGINKVRLKVADIPRDTILWGAVDLKIGETALRTVPLHGRVAIQHPGTAGATVHLHTLSKEQEAAFNHALHPARAPVVELPRATPPPEKPVGEMPAETPRAQPAAACEVPEQMPAARREVAPFSPVPRRAEDAAAVEGKHSPLSNIFSQAEPELPSLVVQPDLPAKADRSKLFQAEPAREGEPDKPAKAAEQPVKSALISPLFTKREGE